MFSKFQTQPFTLGIDATNIRDGGGVTHLVELLSAARPEVHGIERIVVWGSIATLTTLEDRPWLAKIKLTVFTRNDATLNIDGFKDIQMRNNDSVEIRISDRKVAFLRMQNPDLYWGDLSRRLGIRKGN